MSRYEYRSGVGDSWRPRHSRRFSPEPIRRSDSGYDQGHQQQQQQLEQQPSMGLNASYYRDTAAALGLLQTPDGAQPPSPPQPSMELIRMPSHQSANSRSSSCRERGFGGDDRGRGRADSRTPDPFERARGIVQDSFSQTSAGIGYGLLGAVVGGIVANRASEAALKQRRSSSSHGRQSADEAAPRLFTVLGAVAGGLGANAVARKFEDDRERHRLRMWEGRYGSDDDLGRYASYKRTEMDPRGRLLHDTGADDYVYDERRFSRSRHRHRRGNGWDE